MLLESEGKVKDAPETKEYTTQEKKEYKFETKNGGEFKVEVSNTLSKLWAWIKELVRKGNKNQFVISRRNKSMFDQPMEELIAFPITVLVLHHFDRLGCWPVPGGPVQRPGPGYQQQSE